MVKCTRDGVVLVRVRGTNHYFMTGLNFNHGRYQTIEGEVIDVFMVSLEFQDELFVADQR